MELPLGIQQRVSAQPMLVDAVCKEWVAESHTPSKPSSIEFLSARRGDFISYNSKFMLAYSLFVNFNRLIIMTIVVDPPDKLGSIKRLRTLLVFCRVSGAVTAANNDPPIDCISLLREL
ncbi:hypothetical protein MITS9509_02449 [Synechococcus sp. MIT S9509]|nr:hypothetical protein MITS9509_02449 [Synechococcus sp. MIT S9509]